MANREPTALRYFFGFRNSLRLLRFTDAVDRQPDGSMWRSGDTAICGRCSPSTLDSGEGLAWASGRGGRFGANDFTT